MTRPRTAVGYVVRMFPQASETFIANEILELERQGLAVRIYSYRRPRAPVRHAYLRQMNAPVAYLPDPLQRDPLRLLVAHRELLRREPGRYRTTALYVLRHTIRERNPDTWRRFLQAGCLAYLLLDGDVGHLHAHFSHGATRVAMLAGMLTGLPYSFTAHARDIYSDDVDFGLLREKAHLARFAVTVSRHNERYLSQHLGHVDGKVSMLHNGIDLDKFAPDAGAAREPGLVVAVGRLVEKKGFRHLIDACSILRRQGRRVRCEIVGGGELRGALEDRIRELGLEDVVVLVGARSQEEIVDFYRRAQVVAMPAVVASDGNRDALPTVLLEAFACGTPAVASRLTGIPEIVDDGVNGILVEPGSPAELADAIERLLVRADLRERYGAAARAKAERCFDLRQSAGELRRRFAESLGLPASAASGDRDAVRVPVL
jgi:colanic acid/amylovoran biosynthesis glycosyltransferase